MGPRLSCSPLDMQSTTTHQWPEAFTLAGGQNATEAFSLVFGRCTFLMDVVKSAYNPRDVSNEPMNHPLLEPPTLVCLLLCNNKD